VCWKIWYDDGGTYTDRDGPPESAPGRGVQVIATIDESVGWRLVRSADYYIFSPQIGGWEGVDSFGLWDYLADPGHKVVKFGRTIGNREYEDILDRATHDPDFPRKSAWRPSERRPADR
jgi:hypothetical protein